MPTNTEVINRFYSAFQVKDYKTMNDCYSDEIIFSDPAFGILKGEEVRSMWEMLCKTAKDLTIRFSDIEEIDEEYATCKWVATYTFSQTKRRVVNHVKAFMKMENGKIIEHSDAFKISRWAAQALGWKGEFFGWTGWMKSRIQKRARKKLFEYMGGGKWN
jgi:ketosteroid isomerase-like protein